MWDMEVTIAAPTARDREHLADIAGALVEALEETGGDAGPVIVGRYRAENSVLEVGMASAAPEPTAAVSITLESIRQASQRAEIRLGPILAVTLSVATSDVELAPELASA